MHYGCQVKGGPVRDASRHEGLPVSDRSAVRPGVDGVKLRDDGESPQAGVDPGFLREKARQIRVQLLRAVAHAQGGHVGGPLSAAEVLATLYFHEMRIRPSQPDWPERDRFVLSKGHSSIGLYAALALAGYFPVEELRSFDSIDSRLPGHPDMTGLPGIDMSTGSLGVGLSAAVGLALGARLHGHDGRVFALLGDGECHEGAIWEAAFIARRFNLDNLVAIVDANGLAQFGPAADEPGDRRGPWEPGELEDRWTACRWHVITADGHDVIALDAAFREARATKGRPSVVIARTVKGKGVSFMENRWYWHSRVVTPDELALAMAELGERA
jgi:transketolase